MERDAEVARLGLVLPASVERVAASASRRRRSRRRRSRAPREGAKQKPAPPVPPADGPIPSVISTFSAHRRRSTVPSRAKGATTSVEALTAAAATSAAPPEISRAARTAATPRHRQQHRQAVVVGAADDVDEDQRVERDEGGGAARVDAAGRGEARDQRRQPQHRGGGDRLQRPDRGADPQPGKRIGEQGEQRPVGAGRVGPGDVGEGGVGRRRGRGLDVGVEAVQDAEPGVVDVAVDVVGEQRRGQREGEDRHRDRSPDDAPAQPRRHHEHAEVGGEPHPHQDVGHPRLDAQLTTPIPPMGRKVDPESTFRPIGGAAIPTRRLRRSARRHRFRPRRARGRRRSRRRGSGAGSCPAPGA